MRRRKKTRKQHNKQFPVKEEDMSQNLLNCLMDAVINVTLNTVAKSKERDIATIENAVLNGLAGAMHVMNIECGFGHSPDNLAKLVASMRIQRVSPPEAKA
ncbi:MAG: hypothetical protein IT371_07675 [Deltaproteobacteria bacterium]|nr:hypothetical protein [Deltaproteobacteria bacterium]